MDMYRHIRWYIVVSIFLGNIIAYLALMLGVSANICFDGNTLVKLEDGNLKKIKNIKINDILFDGGKVLGLMKFEAKHTLMYIYKNIIVSGDHLVLENNKWIRVCNSKNSVFIPKYDEKYIYCLQTEFNVILINDIIFSDYMEISDIILNNRINNLIKNHLNKEINYNNIENKETFNANQNINIFR